MKNLLTISALLLATALISCQKEETSCYDLPSDFEQLACFECDVQDFTFRGQVFFTDTVSAQDTISNSFGVVDSINGSFSDFQHRIREEYRAIKQLESRYWELHVVGVKNLCTNNKAYFIYRRKSDQHPVMYHVGDNAVVSSILFYSDGKYTTPQGW